MYLIITDIFLRKTFDLINIIQSDHKNINLILTEDNNNKIRVKSKLLYGIPSLTLRKDKRFFFSDLESIIQRHKNCELIYIPVEEDTTLLFYEYTRNNPKKIRFLLPEQKYFDMARDKQKLSEFAMLHEIPVPKEFKHDEIDCNCFPLIVKPKIGSGATGIYYVDTYEQWLKLNIDLNDYLIQEQISNSSKIEGGFFLFHNGKYVSYYGHERLRTYPVKGGISIYSKTKYNARVKFLGTNLLEHLHWSGFAMVEFIFDEKINDYKLIEINPRLWGSFMLSEFSGADFISNYINIIYNKPVTESYFNQNSYIRWIFPFDILYYIKKRFRITGFWKYQQNTCYINFTYSKWYKSLYFILLSIFNLKVLQKLRHKIM